jgi:hypothetical protein
MTTITITPTIYPAHCRQFYFDETYAFERENKPSGNGEGITYWRWTNGRSEEREVWSEVEYAAGSDYTSGGLCMRANYESLSELLAEHHPEGDSPAVWARASGGHGTFALLVRYDAISEECREAIDALEDYPLHDENKHSELQCEAENEAWEQWAEQDFKRALCKHYGECDWPEGVDAYELFRVAQEAANVYWENEQGCDMWIRVERVADKAHDLLEGEPLRWVSAEQVSMLEKAAPLFRAAQAAEEAAS